MTVHLQKDIDRLHQEMLTMSGRVEQMVRTSVALLAECDYEAAVDFGRLDDEIDRLDVEIEDHALKTLALHQPVASDLRKITAVMKLSAELERVADLAVNITERALGLAGTDSVEVPEEVGEMSALAVGMLKESIDAYVREDAALARQVRQSDEAVDDLNRRVIDRLAGQIRERPARVDALLHLFSAARLIEEIADHAVVIAEDVVYYIEGEIIRHQPMFDAPPAA